MKKGLHRKKQSQDSALASSDQKSGFRYPRFLLQRQQYTDLLKRGPSAWNEWRAKNPDTRPDLSRMNLAGANLRDANLIFVRLSEANLAGADLEAANLSVADLSGTNLEAANLRRAYLFRTDLIQTRLANADLRDSGLEQSNFRWADLRGADLRGCWLHRAHLQDADLSSANLSGADLSLATLVRTNLTAANLEGCNVFGISAWSVVLDRANQTGLAITQPGHPAITVDNQEIAQFIHLMIQNDRVRHAIETITTKLVLILGRFSRRRKDVLDAIRTELRQLNYVPVMFDFDVPVGRDLTETISTLAHLARFVIADITEARSVPQELQAIIPTLAVPVQPILALSAGIYGMFQDFGKFPWVLPLRSYRNTAALIARLPDVVSAAEAKCRELQAARSAATIRPNQRRRSREQLTSRSRRRPKAGRA
jgi:uncharacterized protein YjbI with pentapeptide repeats